MNKGFTLIELAIVLVVVGLLVGGILVAQSMIGTSKTQAAVRQIQQFDIAITNFDNKNKGLPGDAASYGGNGNGIIEGPYFTNEISRFWVQLQESGFMSNARAFSATIPAGGFNANSSALNAPQLKLGKNAAVIVTYVGNNNTYNIADWNGETLAVDTITANPYPALKAAEALALDNKMDDGKPAAGVIQNRIDEYSGIIFGSACDDFDGSNAATAKYITSGTTLNCFLGIGLTGQILPDPNSGGG